MNWNVITPADVAAHRDAVAQAVSQRTSPPPAAPASADDYMTKLLKYVPPQIVGAYLLVQGILIALTTDGTSGRQFALGTLLIVGAVSTFAYSARVLGVARQSQRLVSTLAFFVWVFALGGLFATFGWWKPGWGTIALVAFAFFVQFIRLSPNQAATAA
jgi:hypothetical protein